MGYHCTEFNNENGLGENIIIIVNSIKQKKTVENYVILPLRRWNDFIH
jgi:hypothetical protein